MHDEPSRSRFNGLHKDHVAQRAVLTAVIELQPIQVTVSELVRELVRDPESFAERDAVETAVRDLAGIGLLHRHDFLNRPDSLVAPTRAAAVAYDLFVNEGAGDA
jgi:hypothetical protein